MQITTFFMAFIALLVIAVNNVKAQETPQELIPRAFSEYSAKKYRNALRIYDRILKTDPPIEQSLRAFVLFHRAINYAMLHEDDSAMLSLRTAVDNGFAEVEDLQIYNDLQNLRKLPQYEEILEKAKENIAKKKVFNVEEWENPGLGFSYLHQFDSVGLADLVQLRLMYSLDTLKKTSMNQITHQVTVMNWVHGLWRHNPIQSAPSQKCLDILQEVKKGQTFRCMEYASVLAQSLQSLGYSARILELCSEGMSYGLAKAHAAVEVWNDDLQKWIFLDPQNNALWKNKEEFCNADEVREIIETKKDDSLVMIVFPSSWLAVENINPSVWRKYFYYIFLHYDNRYTSNPDILQQLAPICYLRRGQTPELLYQGMPREIDFSTNREKIYPRLNLTHVAVKSVEHQETPTVTMELTHSINSFDHFDVQLDNGKTNEVRTLGLSWNLRRGKNTMTIKGVNKAGLKGKETKVAIEYSGGDK
ncbi:MAG: transglutaminase domain-containing protein [Candidatus Kapaibacterium sp.]|jgi:tetratricopeptide (TPR) repeat protein